jgi:hypothetical protein
VALCRGHATPPHAEAAWQSRPYRGSGRPGRDEAGPAYRKRVSGQVTLGLSHRGIGVQVHLFVLDALPQALDEEIVPPRPAAVHAEGDAVLLDQGDERRAGELAPLVGVQCPGAAALPDGCLQASRQKSTAW